MTSTPIEGSDFQLNIRIGGAAMQTSSEIADQLRRAAAVLEDQGEYGPRNLIDLNGNTVGNWSIG